MVLFELFVILQVMKTEKHSCRSSVISMKSYPPQYPHSSTPLNPSPSLFLFSPPPFSLFFLFFSLSFFFCVCVCVRVCACVHWKKLNPGNPDPIFSKHSILILDTGETQDIISFDGRAGSLTGNSPIVSCEKKCLGVNDESIYEWVRVRRLFVANSRHLVLARIITPKKLIQNTRKCCLLHATNVRFSNFRGWHHISKSRAGAIFLHTQPRKMPYHSQIFARKPGQVVAWHVARVWKWRMVAQAKQASEV